MSDHPGHTQIHQLRRLLSRLLRRPDDAAVPPPGAERRTASAGQGAAREQREYPYWHLWR
jgi:hypothetical protein